MTLTIELTPTAAAQLMAAAQQAGLAPADLVQKLVAEHLPSIMPKLPEDPTLALFAQWDTEDAQMTPEEVTETQRDYNEFTRRMNAERARAEAWLLYP